MIRPLTILLFLTAVLPAHAATLADETQAFLNVIAVSGREEEAAQLILSRLAGLPVTRDAFGNVVVTVGSGAVDTFVSSDSPLESKRFAHARLGRGVVLRSMDNGFLAPRELIARYAALAERHGLPVQVGFTGGATDGMAFLAGVPVMLPFSWPGRYSHSPVEVADLRDLETLVEMIVAVATEDAAAPGSTP